MPQCEGARIDSSSKRLSGLGRSTFFGSKRAGAPFGEPCGGWFYGGSGASPLELRRTRGDTLDDLPPLKSTSIVIPRVASSSSFVRSGALPKGANASPRGFVNTEQQLQPRPSPQGLRHSFLRPSVRAPRVEPTLEGAGLEHPMTQTLLATTVSRLASIDIGTSEGSTFVEEPGAGPNDDAFKCGDFDTLSIGSDNGATAAAAEYYLSKEDEGPHNTESNARIAPSQTVPPPALVKSAALTSSLLPAQLQPSLLHHPRRPSSVHTAVKRTSTAPVAPARTRSVGAVVPSPAHRWGAPVCESSWPEEGR